MGRRGETPVHFLPKLSSSHQIQPTQGRQFPGKDKPAAGVRPWCRAAPSTRPAATALSSRRYAVAVASIQATAPYLRAACRHHETRATPQRRAALAGTWTAKRFRTCPCLYRKQPVWLGSTTTHGLGFRWGRLTIALRSGECSKLVERRRDRVSAAHYPHFCHHSVLMG
jgi:hypothetical protein